MGEIEREISMSAQRLRNLFRGHKRSLTTPAKPAASAAGLAAVSVALNLPALPPGRPVKPTSAEQLPPLPSFLQPKKAIKPMAPIPTTKTATFKAQTFADRLKTVTKKIDADLETGLTTLEALEQSAADANAKINSVVAQKSADVKALTDVLNQLTNGAPEDETGAGSGSLGVNNTGISLGNTAA